VTVDQQLQSARVHLITRFPFLAAPLLRLRLVPDPRISTAATDGRVIRFNPDFIAGLDLQLAAFVLAHEAFHVVAAHHLRRGNRSREIWNIAADFVVNDLLLGAGLPLCQGALYDPRFSGWATERIYQSLGEPSAISEIPSGEGFGGSVEDLASETGDPLNASELAQEQAELTTALRQALQALELTKGCGHLREAIARTVEALSPSFDAYAALLEYADLCLGRDDYSWIRPNRRFLHGGLYLPSLSTTCELDQIVVAVDTSGSISERELRFMAGVCEDILTAFPRATLSILHCDTEVRSDRQVHLEDLPLTLDAQGGGGTRFRPVFQWVEERGFEPRLLIYLTDLFCGDHPSEPAYPVLWLSTVKHSPSPPFGKRINLDL